MKHANTELKIENDKMKTYLNGEIEKIKVGLVGHQTAISKLQTEIDFHLLQSNIADEKLFRYQNTLNMLEGKEPEKQLKYRKLRVGWKELITEVFQKDLKKKWTVTELSDEVKKLLKTTMSDKIVRSSVGSLLSNGRKIDYIGKKEGRKFFYQLKK